MTAPEPTRGNDGALVGGIPLGRYGGIPVRAHWSVLVILVLLTELLAAGALPEAAPGYGTAAYIAVALGGAVAFLATLLAHEIAHALVARRFGMRVKRITLWMLGGMTELGGDPPSARADALIAAAGPATSLAIGGVGAAAAWWVGGDGLFGSVLTWLAAVNILLGVFNLLPGAPLDGGRLLRALLWRRYHDRARAVQAAARTGRALGFGFVALGVLEFLAGLYGGLWFALIGWFMIVGAESERRAGQVEQLYGLTVHDVMTPDPALAPGWLTLAAFIDQLTPQQLAQPAFPVVGFDGQPEGMLTARELTLVSPARRAEVRVRDACRRRKSPPMVEPDTPLADVLTPLRMHGVVLVASEGHIVGMVTQADIDRAVGLARLGWQRHHTPA